MPPARGGPAAHEPGQSSGPSLTPYGMLPHILPASLAPPLPLRRPPADWLSSAKPWINVFARSTCSCVPVTLTWQQSSSFSIWTFAPLCCRTSEILAPREPMILPVAATGYFTVSETELPPPPVMLEWSARPLPPPCPPSACARIWTLRPSSARRRTMPRALPTCSGVPEICTRQTSSSFSTWTLAPLCCRTSEIFAPRDPMMPPISETGNSMVSELMAPEMPSASSGPPARPGSAPAADLSAISLIIALARCTASGVPLILNSHCSSFLSSASTRAPVLSRILLIVTPCLPITRPMRWRGSLTTSALFPRWSSFRSRLRPGLSRLRSLLWLVPLLRRALLERRPLRRSASSSRSP
mmetsp:Transcript_23538/g.65977  ORF Transcript_23538/g.65977 Transcript_23538/m.65977 type:complete len:356 (+) Transcript_23538:206-1273(+)